MSANLRPKNIQLTYSYILSHVFKAYKTFHHPQSLSPGFQAHSSDKEIDYRCIFRQAMKPKKLTALPSHSKRM
jgi:hypothetical protein